MASSSNESGEGQANHSGHGSVLTKLSDKVVPIEEARLELVKNPIKYAQHDGTLSTEAHDKDYMELTLKSGKHSERVRSLLRQRIEQRAKEFPRWPGSQTSGVRAIWIESRFWYDRERLLPAFDDDWRRYRANYLHSLELDPREPVHVPEYETAFLNPIRRFYMKGGDFLEDKFIKRFTKDRYQSATWRFVLTRCMMGYVLCTVTYYYLRYNYARWEYRGGPMLGKSAPIVYPGDPRYPFEDPRTEPAHHFDFSFSRRKVFRDLRYFDSSTGVI